MPPRGAALDGPFEFLDVTNFRQIQELVRRHEVGTIYHLAALLSATSEEKPHVAWELNMGGLYKVLEVARENRCAVFFPSSIGAFGPGTPRDRHAAGHRAAADHDVRRHQGRGRAALRLLRTAASASTCAACASPA